MIDEQLVDERGRAPAAVELAHSLQVHVPLRVEVGVGGAVEQ